MARREIIAIGGSAESVKVIRRICVALPADLQASALIAVHVRTGNQNPSGLVDIKRCGGMTVSRAL